MVVGVAWLAWAWRCDLRYCERHLLPEYAAAVVPHEYVVARTWRLIGIGLGLAFLLAGPFAGRWVARIGPAEAAATCARMGVALVLALVAGEIGMRVMHLPHTPDWGVRTEIRIGQPDARYGWLYVASRSTVLHHATREIEYSIDAEHRRVATPTTVLDPSLPSLVFTGESITAGQGLQYEETWPALVSDALGLQAINLATHGYGADQSFLRLYDELPKIQRPVAVLVFFLFPMIARMDQDTHPHLFFEGDVPQVTPAGGFFSDLHVVHAFRAAVPYRDGSTLERAAKVFRDTDKMVRARGARPIFVAPGCWTGHRYDQYLVDELFTNQGLEVMDASWDLTQLPEDNHPNQAWTRRLADEVIAMLRRDLASR